MFQKAYPAGPFVACSSWTCEAPPGLRRRRIRPESALPPRPLRRGCGQAVHVVVGLCFKPSSSMAIEEDGLKGGGRARFQTLGLDCIRDALRARLLHRLAAARLRKRRVEGACASTELGARYHGCRRDAAALLGIAGVPRASFHKGGRGLAVRGCAESFAPPCDVSLRWERAWCACVADAERRCGAPDPEPACGAIRHRTAPMPQSLRRC